MTVYRSPIELLSTVESSLLAARAEMDQMSSRSIAYDAANRFWLAYRKAEQDIACLPLEPHGFRQGTGIAWPLAKWTWHDVEMLAEISGDEVRDGFDARRWRTLLDRILARAEAARLIDGCWPGKEAL